MKKLVTCAALVFLAWLGVCTAWAVTARSTGLPGPARAAYGTLDAAADALESFELPAPLAASRRIATHRIRSSGRALARLYAVPERIAARLLRAHGHWHRDRWDPSGDREWPDRAPAAAPADVDAEAARRIEALAPRIEVRIARIEAVASHLDGEIARNLHVRLERLRDAEIRIRRAERAVSVERRVSRFER